MYYSITHCLQKLTLTKIKTVTKNTMNDLVSNLVPVRFCYLAGCRWCSTARETGIGEARNISPGGTVQSNILYIDTLKMAKSLESRGIYT